MTDMERELCDMSDRWHALGGMHERCARELDELLRDYNVALWPEDS